MEKEDVMWFILVKLTNMKKFGGAHTSLRNITKGMPSSITSNRDGKKLIQDSIVKDISLSLSSQGQNYQNINVLDYIKELGRNEFLLAKPSTGEIHISLNPRKIKEIREFIEKYKK